jgi:hypothetical protein
MRDISNMSTSNIVQPNYKHKEFTTLTDANSELFELNILVCVVRELYFFKHT